MRITNVSRLLVLLLTSLATACGGARSDAAVTTADRATETVTIADFKFAPEKLDVERGTTVVWKNEDAFLHTVTSGDFSGDENEPDGAFDERLPTKGSTAEVTFDDTGTFTYFCRQHNVMNAEVRVS